MTTQNRFSGVHLIRTLEQCTAAMRRINASVWGGGDGGFSVVMPDGRSYWLYSDSATDTLTGNFQFIHQAVHTYDNVGFSVKNLGLSFLPIESDGTFYWVSGGVAVGANRMLLTVIGVKKTGDGYFDFKGVSVRACYVNINSKGDLVFDRWLTYWPTSSSERSVGWSFPYLDGSTLVVFGTRWDEGEPARKIFVASVPLANVETGSSWTFGDTPIRPEPISGAGVSVRKDGSTWRILTGEAFQSSDIFVYEATSLSGPWSKRVLAHFESSKDFLAYLPMWHPEIKLANGKAVVTYSLNAAAPGYAHVLSRPKFIEVTL